MSYVDRQQGSGANVHIMPAFIQVRPKGFTCTCSEALITSIKLKAAVLSTARLLPIQCATRLHSDVTSPTLPPVQVWNSPFLVYQICQTTQSATPEMAFEG